MKMGFDITDEDIRYVEKHLNVENVDFSDDQRQEAIKTLETKDIRACPGSGKTTLLVAKLAILARKWPHSHQGICILSHTNVARDQIVERLPVSSSQRLLSYPHFVGTIQSFIDRFVAIPACLARFRCTPSLVDNARFASVAQYEYHSGPYTKLRSYLNNQQNREEIIDDLQFRWDGGLKVDLSKTRLKNEDSSSYKQLLHLKEKVSGEGVFRFEDMFALAKWYMTEYPRIVDLVAKRFPLVFIDEMQDTDALQDDVLWQLFGTKSILQRFGDPNQAIFGGILTNAHNSSFPRKGYLTIEKSYRVSPSIAEKIERMCLNPQKIKGNEGRENLKHTIILFNKETIKNVLTDFGEIVLRECGDPPFPNVKAVGAIGKERGQDQTGCPYSISDYWPDYISKKSTEQRKREAFAEYMHLAAEKMWSTGSCGYGRDYLLDGLVEVLRRQGCRTPEERYYTRRKLVERLKNHAGDSLQCLLEFLYKYCRLLIAHETHDRGQLASDAKHVLTPLLNREWGSKVDKFLSSNSSCSELCTGDAESVAKSEQGVPNIYKYEDSRGNLDIHVTTIHKAKGETHHTTLVLETHFHRHDLKALVPFLIGEPPEDIGERQKKYLKQIFVAMSRPKHLVCLAMNEEHLSEEDITKLDGLGWSFVPQNRKAQSSLFDF